MSAAKTRAGSAPPPMPQIDRLLSGSPAALARAITAVENEAPEAEAISRQISPHLGHALVVGFTGAPGVGKSTLVSAYVRLLRQREQSVGVVAVDPSSPFSGGSILGDRIRMAEHADDPQVFVRSLAARGHLGGLSRTTARVVDVFDAAGKDFVIVETVGTGQSEVEIAGLAHTKVVICTPGLGDAVQAVKAGILEIADILVVNKSDQPGADDTRRHLLGMLKLFQRPGWKPKVVTTSATEDTGVDELARAIDAHREQFPADATQTTPQRLLQRPD